MWLFFKPSILCLFFEIQVLYERSIVYTFVWNLPKHTEITVIMFGTASFFLYD